MPVLLFAIFWLVSSQYNQLWHVTTMIQVAGTYHVINVEISQNKI